MTVLEKLNDFCRPVSNFWWSDGATICQFYQPASNATTCHDVVDISLCFEDTAILYCICAIFWVLSALFFLFGRNCILRPKLSFGILHAAKLIFLAIPFITGLCDLIYSIVQGQRMTIPPFQYISPVVICVSMGLSALVIHQNRSIGHRTSWLMFLYWLAMVVYGSIKLRTYVLISLDQMDVLDDFRYATFIFQYVTYLVQLLLSVFPESKVRTKFKSTEEQQRKPCLEENATFLSLITCWWQNDQLWQGWRRPLTHDDLTDLNSVDKSSKLVPQFQRNWKKELKKAGISFDPEQLTEGSYKAKSRHIASREDSDKKPSLVWVLAKTYWKKFVLSGIFKLLRDVLLFASPLLLKSMIEFTNDECLPGWYGYLYSGLFFVTNLLRSTFMQLYLHQAITVGMRMRTVIVAAVYRKALCLSNKARQTTTVGEIINLMSVDTQCIMNCAQTLQLVWSAPFQIIVSLIYLYFTMGISIFAGVGVLILIVMVNACLGSWSRTLQVKQMSYKDSRIKLMTEILNAIKVIKLYAWEIPFQRIILGIRRDELKQIRNKVYLLSVMFFTWTSSPFLVSLATFATYTFIDPERRLTANEAFVALALFNILQDPLIKLPLLISNLIQVSVSIKRLRRFLTADELDPNTVERTGPDMESSITVRNAHFNWNGEGLRNPTLSNIDLRIGPGQLVAVVGQVGSGKTSLIHALLGEMEKLGGNVTLKGSVAYVPQEAWIQNATLRDNILFESNMDVIKYERTIKACALETDLDILPGRDFTEIGERGINLSSGQKQRVSLARAVYQDSDIYLLDDPLSAVDSHVGRHIFENIIGPRGVLKDKVRLLVTHGIVYLPQCDYIVVMSDGTISEIGTYSELVENEGPFAQFLSTYQSTQQDEEKDSESKEVTHAKLGLSSAAMSLKQRREYRSGSLLYEQGVRYEQEEVVMEPEYVDQSSRAAYHSDTEDELTEHTTLISEEKATTGNIKLSVILAYCLACTWYVTIVTLALFVLAQAATITTNFWLSKWSNANTCLLLRNQTIDIEQTTSCNVSNTDFYYLGVYTGIGVAQSLLLLASAISLGVGIVFATRTLHNKLLENILHCPMSYFDTTPLGRVLNRFSLDTFTIDETIPSAVQSFLYRLLMLFGIIIVIVIATPTFLIVILPLGLAYYYVQRFYMATSHQLKRLDSISRSPIYSHFQESIQGASSIRAYRQQERFIRENERRIDYNQLAYYPSKCAERWMSTRVALIGNFVVFFVAFFVTIQRNYSNVIHLSISPGLVGLSISFALLINQCLGFVLQTACTIETNIIAVERIKEYSEFATEAPAIITNDNQPPDDWPSEGHVRFDHYSTRYRKGLNLALKDINLDIPPGTKIGIVGRTGAGKTSMILSLFRILEAAGGAILVDDVNIAYIGLEQLRSRITIIPQDPVLISGTLRMNLDPFDSYSIKDLWHALDSAHLASFVTSSSRGLLHPVTEYGDNLSIGQRQLVCLARALLRKTKILVLDEATGSVDLKTDELVQKTIKNEFRDCTVITIAHRLSTVMEYDRIVVLDNGEIIECDHPEKLLADKQSAFYSLAKDAGLAK